MQMGKKVLGAADVIRSTKMALGQDLVPLSPANTEYVTFHPVLFLSLWATGIINSGEALCWELKILSSHWLPTNGKGHF